MLKKGSKWNEIHHKIYRNEKLLKMRTKAKGDKLREENMKKLLELLASDESVNSIEKSNSEGFKRYVQELGNKIGGKESREGWKGLKALSKYQLVGKKEAQI